MNIQLSKSIVTLRIIPVLLFLTPFFCSCNGSKDEKEVLSSTKGVVSTAHPLATKAGVTILQQGGNAFDAAVTIAATLNVVEPMMSGMGGYGTILIYDAEKQLVRFLDSSGKIPENTNSDLMRYPTPDFKQNRRGAKAVSTPGNVNAWFSLSDQYGTLEWKDLFELPIELADEGFPVSQRLGNSIRTAYHSFSVYTRSFYGMGDNPLKVGDTLRQKDLANSFRQIAQNGTEAFYTNKIARAISKSMNDTGGFLSYQDLRNDKAEWWEPVSIDYHGFEVFTASPPATAFPSLIRLGLMENFKGLDHNSIEYLHAFAESTKFAYLSRLLYAGDPEINPPPLDLLLSAEYLDKAAAAFDLNRASEMQLPGMNEVESQNTTHFVVADKWGNIVSATQTLGNLFGSRIMPEGTGIWLNNSLAYCTYEPKGNPMDAIPGQRKLSGDCPTIIFRENKPWVALGTPGGHTIGQTVPQMVMNLIDFKMGLQEAIDAPRVSFIEPNNLAIEFGISDDVFYKLQLMGHNVTRISSLGNAHALMINYDEEGSIINFSGAADIRGAGSSMVID